MFSTYLKSLKTLRLNFDKKLYRFISKSNKNLKALIHSVKKTFIVAKLIPYIVMYGFLINVMLHPILHEITFEYVMSFGVACYFILIEVRGQEL